MQEEDKKGEAPFDGMNQDMRKWTTISSRLVEPEVKKEAEWIEWSLLDRLFSGFYSSYIFLYKPKPKVTDGDYVLPVDRLIESLGKVLDHFHTFAGRLIKDDKDEFARLYCNNEGALFKHKCYDGIASELIDEDQFQHNEHISGLFDIDPRAETYNLSGIPTLIIQVTDFQCGTRCLSTSWSHMVADGFSDSLSQILGRNQSRRAYLAHASSLSLVTRPQKVVSNLRRSPSSLFE